MTRYFDCVCESGGNGKYRAVPWDPPGGGGTLHLHLGRHQNQHQHQHQQHWKYFVPSISHQDHQLIRTCSRLLHTPPLLPLFLSGSSPPHPSRSPLLLSVSVSVSLSFLPVPPSFIPGPPLSCPFSLCLSHMLCSRQEGTVITIKEYLGRREIHTHLGPTFAPPAHTHILRKRAKAAHLRRYLVHVPIHQRAPKYLRLPSQLTA